jgi:hypothetical protein
VSAAARRRKQPAKDQPRLPPVTTVVFLIVFPTNGIVCLVSTSIL